MNELSTPANSAVSIIQQAIQTGADPAYLKELLAVRREWEADEARKAYFAAISEFQRQAPIIPKGDDAHGKQYARMDRIWRTVRELFTDLGLSCTWQVCTIGDGVCHVEGQLAHKQGHGVPLIMDVALPELIRGQNLAQQVGSARTYAQRYAFCAATGVQTGEDDDGLTAGTQYVTKEQADELVAILGTLADRESALAAMLEYAECDSVSDIPADKFAKCKKGLLTKPKK